MPTRNLPSIRTQRQRMGRRLHRPRTHRTRRGMPLPPTTPRNRSSIIPRRKQRRRLVRYQPRNQLPNRHVLPKPRLSKQRLLRKPRALRHATTIPNPSGIQHRPPTMLMSRMGHSQILRNRLRMHGHQRKLKLRMPRRKIIPPRNHLKHHRTGLIDLKTSQPPVAPQAPPPNPVVPKRRLGMRPAKRRLATPNPPPKFISPIPKKQPN